MDVAILLDTVNLNEAENTVELKDSLESIVNFTEYELKSIKGLPEQFIAEFNVDIKSELDAQKFLSDYHNSTKEVLRVATSKGK